MIRAEVVAIDPGCAVKPIARQPDGTSAGRLESARISLELNCPLFKCRWPVAFSEMVIGLSQAGGLGSLACAWIRVQIGQLKDK